MADSQVEHVRRSTQETVPQFAYDRGDGTYALAVLVSGVAQVAPPELVPVARTLEIAVADTEYSIALPANYGFEFKARQALTVRFAFESGVVAAPQEPYMTLPASWHHYQPGRFDALTLYFAVDVGFPPVVMEIITLELA